VILRIFDLAGNIVFTETQAWHLRKDPASIVTWNLRNNAGRDVFNGIYLIHVEATGVSGKIHTYATRIVVKRS